MDDHAASLRAFPPNMKPLTDEEFEREMDAEFGNDVDHSPSSLFAKDVSVEAYRRVLLSLAEERNRYGMIRNVLAHTHSNMVKPTTEAKVLFIASSAALNLVMGTDEEVARGISLLSQAVNEVALSMAGKLDLDVIAWSQRDAEVQQSGGEPLAVNRPVTELGAIEVSPRQGRIGEDAKP